MPGLKLSLFGPLTITLDGEPFDGVRLRPTLALCSYLACQPGRHRREHLMALLWPDWPQVSAQQNLRQNLYVLRQALPEINSHNGDHVPLVLADRDTVQLNPAAVVEVDVLRFTGLLENPQPTPLQLAEAVALYHGDFLADFYLSGSEPFEEWAEARRADLRRMMLEALDSLTVGAIERNVYGEAMAYARRQLEIDNLREIAHRQLMLALARSGQRASALSHYEACRRLLRDELGVEPSAETRALAERIVADEEGGSALAVELVKSSAPRHNLPLQLSSFIGRERELVEVQRLIETSRLVTLTGAGGSGKTRLALQAARASLGPFPDGVWFVELAPLSDPTLVASVVASTLGLIEDKDRPLVDTLVGYLRNRGVLLLLDNCEHLIKAAAQLAETLLAHCPKLHILVTSREVLGIAGEVVWLAPTLALPLRGEQPSVEDLGQYDAVRLFVERASAALPAFALTEHNAAAVVQCCRQLDGIPLAIELAAARVKLLRVEQIVARLDDRFGLLAGGNRTAPPRHQTLRALIDWSHDLLPPVEQRLLRRLSVFANGFTLEAVELVCDEENEGDVLESLAQLVNKSLVAADRASGQEARYDLHETIRQYAWARLGEAGEAGRMQERHAAYYCRLLEEALPRFHYDDRAYLRLDWLETEYQNWQALMSRSLDDSAVSREWGIRVASRLAGFWLPHGRIVEGRRWLDAALERADGATISTRAVLYARTAWLIGRYGDTQAPEMATKALALFRQLEDVEGIVHMTVTLSFQEYNFEQARSNLEQSLAPAAEVGGASLTGVYFGLMSVALRTEDFELALEYGEKALSIQRGQGGSRIRQQELLNKLGSCFMHLGKYDRATALLLEALALARALKLRGPIMAATLNSLGENARLQKKYDQANAYYHDTLAVAHESGDMLEVAFTLSDMGFSLIAQGDLRQARTVLREGLSILSRVSDLPLFGLWALARLAELSEEPVRAARLHGAAELLEESTSLFLGPVDRQDISRSAGRARAQLGDAAYNAAWAEGQAMSREEAFAYAMEE